MAIDARDGDNAPIGQALRYFLALPLWWPFASLAYCAYLTQMAVDVFVYGEWVHPPHNDIDYIQKLYWGALGTNLAVAIVLNLVVERPCLKLRNAFAPSLHGALLADMALVDV